MNSNKDFALFVIDADGEFWNKDMAKQHPHIPGNFKKLLSLCRKIGIEVIHLRIGPAELPTGNSHLMIKGTKSAGKSKHVTMKWAAAVPGEKIFHKNVFDGLLDPEVLRYLKKRKIKTVLTCGFVTSVCVLFTTIAATQRGLFAAIVEDCTGDWGKAHKHTLDHYAGSGFFDRVSLASIEKSLSKWKTRNKRFSKIKQYHKLLAPLA